MEHIDADRKITYAHVAVDYRLQKPNTVRVKFTVNENLIDDPHEVTKQTADVVTAKILWYCGESTPTHKIFLC